MTGRQNPSPTNKINKRRQKLDLGSWDLYIPRLTTHQSSAAWRLKVQFAEPIMCETTACLCVDWVLTVDIASAKSQLQARPRLNF